MNRRRRVRKLPLETAIIERYKRRESSVEEALIEMYLAGVSMRRVEDITEVRRRTRVVGAFPDGQSALMLVAARLRHVAGTRWGTRKYLDMSRLRETARLDDRLSEQDTLTPSFRHAVLFATSIPAVAPGLGQSISESPKQISISN